jgi:hypothetical protein
VKRVRTEDGGELRENELRELFPEGLTCVHFEPKTTP